MEKLPAADYQDPAIIEQSGCVPPTGDGHVTRGRKRARVGIIEFGTGKAAGPDAVLRPPAIRTLPSGSRVAVCRPRAVVILPVAKNAPVWGSYNSALKSFDPLAAGNQDLPIIEQRGRMQ